MPQYWLPAEKKRDGGRYVIYYLLQITHWIQPKPGNFTFKEIRHILVWDFICSIDIVDSGPSWAYFGQTDSSICSLPPVVSKKLKLKGEKICSLISNINNHNTFETHPFLKKNRSPLMEVAASNTRLRLHCSSLGLGRGPWFGSSVGSSGSGAGSGDGLGFGRDVGAGVRLPERWINKIQSDSTRILSHNKANEYQNR